MQELCQGQLLVRRDGSQLMMAVSTGHLKKEEREDGENLVCCGGKRISRRQIYGSRGGNQRILCFGIPAHERVALIIHSR